MKVQLCIFSIQMQVCLFRRAVFFFTFSARILCDSLFGWASTSEHRRTARFFLVGCPLFRFGSCLIVAFSVIVVKAFHDLLKFLSLYFLFFFHFFDFFFVFFFVCVIVQVYFSNWRKICRRLNLKVEEFFVMILSKPRMGQYFLYSVNGAESLFWLFTQEAFQQIFAFRCQRNIWWKSQIFRENGLINFIGISAIKRWQSSQKFI